MITVLLVDDVADLRRLVRLALEASGRFEVVAEAADGLAAIEAAGRHRPDLILLDLAMPVMDGLSALPELRRVAPAASVVVLTGLEKEAVSPALSGGGAVGFLGKDLSPRVLVQELLTLGALLGSVDDVVAEAMTNLGRDLASPGSARRFVGEALARWGCEVELEVVKLLVSELVTNAVLHGASGSEVAVRLTPSAVRVSVSDDCEAVPVLRDATDHETSGRGIALMDTLASAWGVEPRAVGKSVWFEVGRDATSGGPPAGRPGG